MQPITILLIAIGLAMDALAVSISSGIAMKRLKINHAVTIAAFFGSFQAIMPLIGWLAGLGTRDFISEVDHWVAFGLLSLIGCKMIYKSTKMDPSKKILEPMNLYVLLALSVATSIDALAVGVTFAFIDVLIISPIIIIGVVTFVLSFIGVCVGDRVGHLFENKIEILGGLILIAIGTKILIDHLF